MARLTKEEKKARKEAKRLEKLAAAEELRKKLKRDELQREMAAQSLHRRDLERGWREMMLTVKLPVFRQQVEVMWSTFERVYDKKDGVIQGVMLMMEEADAQYGRTVASFCETLDNMTSKLHAELEEMSRENATRTSELLLRGRSEAAAIAGDHGAAETHVQLMLYHGHAAADELAWRTRGESLVKADEERDRCLNEIDGLRSYLENTYTLMWGDYRAVLTAYVTGTADNQKKVRRLRRKENLMADIIASQSKQMVSNQRNIRKMRYELQQYESGSKQAAFRERRDRYRAAYRAIKRTMEQGCALDSVQLGMVVAASDTASQWLEAAQNKGERILRMAVICRKFETQREKVLPFGARAPRSPPQYARDRRGKPVGDALVCEARDSCNGASQSAMGVNVASSRSAPSTSHGEAIPATRKHDDTAIVTEIAATAGLNRLWQRMSRAHVTREALAREKQYLRRENAMILQQLQQDKGSDEERARGCRCDAETYPGCRPVAVDGNQAYKLRRGTH